MPYPVLYTFRRCPYAIRARLAIATANISVECREVVLRNKPASMLEISAKGTVPVLQLSNGQIIDESLDIMNWALSQHDNHNWLQAEPICYQALIDLNDGEFKYYLDRYKYPDRYPEHPQIYYRKQASTLLQELEQRLQQHRYICGPQFSFADAAIMPFIRQFSHVDLEWFKNSEYYSLSLWLQSLLDSKLFLSVMEKFPPWSEGDDPLIFPD